MRDTLVAAAAERARGLRQLLLHGYRPQLNGHLPLQLEYGEGLSTWCFGHERRRLAHRRL